MKKVLIVLGSLLILFLIVLITIPIIFKDDIKKAIDDAIAENVNAQVYFDPSGFNLSFFSHFPSLTVAMEDFGVVNNAPFQGDTLISVQKFEIAINVLSLFGDKIELNGIYLNQPDIYVKILKDGRANYDIAKSSEEVTEETEESTESGDFSIGIKKWEIKEANLVYIDLSSAMQAIIQNLNHSGSGDFTQSIFDLSTKTSISSIDFSMEGTDYLKGNSFQADIILNMNLDNNTYTFKENTIKMNDFGFGFDGTIVLGDDFQEYDLTYQAKETSFKSILSLVPAVFMKDFETLKTSGNLSFDGFVKGKLQGENLPDFALNLLINEGMFQYPELPSAVKNVTVDLNVKKVGSSLEATEVDLKKFHLEMGNNPIDITAKTKGLEDIEMMVNALVKFNLEDIATFYPMEGMELKGIFDLKANVNGRYNETTMPNIDADLKLVNGYFKSPDVPAPIENMQMIANAKSAGGDMEKSSLDVESFKMTFDGNPIEAFLHLENFNDYTYRAGMNGKIDIGKMMKMFPQEGMDLSGIMTADIETSGKMSDIDAERYDQLPTSGKLGLQQFAFKSEDLPQGLTISDANLNFTPKEAILQNYQGTLGKSDMSMSGSFSNYIGYVLKDKTLKGNLNYSSQTFDLNEWMTEEEEEVSSTETEMEEELVIEPIPANIDFTLNAKIDKILYENSDISNLKGQIIVRDGAVDLKNTSFNMIGGSFVTNGKYDTKDISKPYFSFDLDIKTLEIPKAFEAFVTIQEMAPMAKNMTGKVNSVFHVDGILLQNYDPDLATLSGGGILSVYDASMKEFNLINKLNQVAKFAGLNAQSSNEYPLNDFKVKAEIRDGKVFFEPFDVTAGGNKMTIGGNYGLDGQLDYTVNSEVAANALTGAAAGLLNSFSGSNFSGSGPVKLNFGVTGTQDDPIIKLLGVDSKDGSPKNIAKTTIDNVKSNVNDDARKKAKEQADKILAEAKRNSDRIRSEGKRSADIVRQQSNQQADELVKKANNPIAKKAAQEAAKKMRKEGEDKARAIEIEANKKADQMMNESQKKADQILKNP